MGFSSLSGNEPKYPPIPKDAGKDYNGSIIIIGAGVSGLFAANALQHMGVQNYTVLEASDRVGGRLKRTDAGTIHNDVPLDVGAEWIHHTGSQVVRDMLIFDDQEGVGGKDTIIEGLEPSEFVKYQPKFYFRKNERSFMQCLYQETKWNTSTWSNWLDTFVYRPVEERVKVNCPVTKISYGSGSEQIKVELQNGDVHTADKVICTIPLAVLKKEVGKEDNEGGAESIFDPPLPKNKLEAIDAINMPPGLRVLFEMKEKFYPDVTIDNTILGQVMDGDELCAIYDPLLGKDLPDGDDSQNVLAFVAIGDKYADIAKLNDEDLALAALAKIDELFDGQGTKNHIQHVVQNWTQEPFILGSYTTTHDSKHQKALGETLNGKLLFAGEHTSVKYHSLVNGAAMEGRRAAMEALSGHLKNTE